MVQGLVFVKRGGWHFSYLVFSRFIIFKFRNFFVLCKIALYVGLCYHNFMKKVIRSCLKMNLKISHVNHVRFISLFV